MKIYDLEIAAGYDLVFSEGLSLLVGILQGFINIVFSESRRKN